MQAITVFCVLALSTGFSTVDAQDTLYCGILRDKRLSQGTPYCQSEVEHIQCRLRGFSKEDFTDEKIQVYQKIIDEFMKTHNFDCHPNISALVENVLKEREQGVPQAKRKPLGPTCVDVQKNKTCFEKFRHKKCSGSVYCGAFTDYVKCLIVEMNFEVTATSSNEVIIIDTILNWEMLKNDFQCKLNITNMVLQVWEERQTSAKQDTGNKNGSKCFEFHYGASCYDSTAIRKAFKQSYCSFMKCFILCMLKKFDAYAPLSTENDFRERFLYLDLYLDGTEKICGYDIIEFKQKVYNQRGYGVTSSTNTWLDFNNATDIDECLIAPLKSSDILCSTLTSTIKCMFRVVSSYPVDMTEELFQMGELLSFFKLSKIGVTCLPNFRDIYNEVVKELDPKHVIATSSRDQTGKKTRFQTAKTVGNCNEIRLTILVEFRITCTDWRSYLKCLVRVQNIHKMDNTSSEYQSFIAEIGGIKHDTAVQCNESIDGVIQAVRVEEGVKGDQVTNNIAKPGADLIIILTSMILAVHANIYDKNLNMLAVIFSDRTITI